jgi:hypothetical protein
MPSLLHTTEREAVLRRLRQLQPSTKPRWGTFTAPKMICHMGDAFRVGFGDVSTKRMDTLPRRTLVKWLVIYSPMPPPPGKVQTAPEMLATVPTNWSKDMATVEELIARMATTPMTAVHPFFGPLTNDGWGRLNWKHLDHHLRQFGC